MVNVKSPRGELLVKGMKIACMTNDEEKQLNEELPFYVEDKLEQLGAEIETSTAFKPNVVIDEERLLTAQNPQSSMQFAQRLESLIEKVSRV